MQTAHLTIFPRRAVLRCLVLALAVASLGCRTGHAARDANGGTLRTTIDVQNEDFNDMTVYVLANGARTRLGIAPGNKTTVLTIPAYLLDGVPVMRFVADPIGGNRTPVSEEVNVNPGDELVMVIQPGG
ncbi:MAG TPA: hypothetical protein VGJ12_16730 [Gemmatimonadaceae bacterium]